MASSPIGYEGKVSTANTASAINTPGESIEVVDSTGLKRYKYVKYDNGTVGTALSNGAVVYFLDGTDFDGYTVTIDESDTQASLVMGVANYAITDQYYGWVQTWGYHSAIKTDAGDDIVAGDALIPHASTDGVVDRTAEGTAPVTHVVGWAVADDVNAADTVAGYIVLE